jgi:hypothetical protein
MAKPTHWLSDEEYQKARTQLRLQFGGVMRKYAMHGFQNFIDPDIETLVKLAEDFALRVRGVDKPISLEYVTRRKK